MRLIDVSELKEWVENWFEMNKYYHPYSKSNNIPITELYDILEQIPTIDAEPRDAEPRKHGRWIYKVLEPSKVGFYICSECGYVAVNEKVYHYCYNCGARMEGVEE